ncbi:hypothetical protein RB597_007154 [Gaeumannomyces tritici]
MGKKKRSHPDVEEILARPWCFYCERDFEDLKLLISHQKAKHFKCDRCGRRLNTAGGLAVHMNQVHKETLDRVENAIDGRDGLDIEIFGMEGVPEDLLNQHRTKIITDFYSAQEERRAATGNPPAGTQGPAKKLKMETPEELKKRLAEHKARRAMQKADVASPIQTASPGAFYAQPGFPGSQAYAASSLPTRPPGNVAVGQGLPQRPPYGAHAGAPQGGAYPQYPTSAGAGVPSTLDDLVSGAAQSDHIDQLIRLAEAGVKSAGDGAAEPKSKKDKSTRMVVAGSAFSLEEMMVQWRGIATGA